MKLGTITATPSGLPGRPAHTAHALLLQEMAGCLRNKEYTW